MPGRKNVSPEKMKEVENTTNLIYQNSIIGIVSMRKLPESAFQKMKKVLDGKASIKVLKKCVLLRSLEKTGMIGLEKYVGNYPGLIVSNMNPFKLYKLLQENKSKASAKPGDIALADIEVKAGPTDLMPGPAISTLASAGLQAKVEAGKIAVMRDKVVCKKGEAVNANLASILQLLKIEPMEIGIDLLGIWEHGTVYDKADLSIDQAKVLSDLSLGSLNAFNLAFNSGYPTKQTVELMINKAFRNAKSLGLEANILDKGIIEDILAKAKRQADVIQSKTG